MRKGSRSNQLAIDLVLSDTPKTRRRATLPGLGGNLAWAFSKIITITLGRVVGGLRALAPRARKSKEAYYADALSLEDFKLEQD